jgi:uncharacterized protein RhaS with RHS repeats
MQARYYDPVIGRFYSNDPVGWTPKNPAMSFNRYLYVNNNPYKYTDPNGEFLATILAGAGIGALISGGLETYKQLKSGGELDLNRIATEAGKGAILGAGVIIAEGSKIAGKAALSDDYSISELNNDMSGMNANIIGAVAGPLAQGVASVVTKNPVVQGTVREGVSAVTSEILKEKQDD